jgi:spore germination protein KB
MLIGMSILVSMNSVIAAAKQDAWISIILSSVIAILNVIVAAKLSLIYPNNNLIEYGPIILGKYLGKLVTLPYLLICYVTCANDLLQLSTILQVTILKRTPSFAIIVLMMLTAIYAAIGGIKVIARCAEAFGAIVFIIFICIMLLGISNIKFKNLSPVFGEVSWVHIFKGIPGIYPFLADSILCVLMLFSFIEQSAQKIKTALSGVVLVSVFLVLATLMVLLTIGAYLGSNIWYPFFEMSRIISLFRFIENVNPFLILVWISSVFIKISLFLFMGTYSTAQWIEIKKWKSLLWVTSPVIILLTFIPKNIIQIAINFPRSYLSFASIFYIFIPFILWIIAYLLKRQAVK